MKKAKAKTSTKKAPARKQAAAAKAKGARPATRQKAAAKYEQPGAPWWKTVPAPMPK